MNNFKLKFKPGDVVYEVTTSKEGDLTIAKGIVEYCYITKGNYIEYLCEKWGAEVKEEDLCSEKELIQRLPKLLKQLKTI